MSIINTENNTEEINYESLYKKLKEECEENKQVNDEIFKEYESTIQLLTDSANKYESEKKDFINKITKFENDIKILIQEKENLIRKNKDKIIDIQCLNEQNEKLNKLMEKYKEERTVLSSRIVSLENDVEHFGNKIREYEDFIEELKNKLEIALEENITMQHEFGNYKLNSIEQMARKEEEIKQLREDINCKDVKIKKLSQNSKEKFDIQKMQQKLIKEKKLFQYNRRRYTVFDNSNNKLNITQDIFNSQKYIDSDYNKNKNYYKSPKGDYHFSNCTTPRDTKFNNVTSFSNYLNTDKKIKKRKNEMNGLNTINSINNINNIIVKENNNKSNLNKKFEDLIISYELKLNLIGIKKCDEFNLYKNNNERNIEFEKELKNIMIRIQRRKNDLINLKKYINQKLAKLDIKIK